MSGGCKNRYAFELTVKVLRGRFKVPKARIRTSANSTTSYLVLVGHILARSFTNPDSSLKMR